MGSERLEGDSGRLDNFKGEGRGMSDGAVKYARGVWHGRMMNIGLEYCVLFTRTKKYETQGNGGFTGKSAK